MKQSPDFQKIQEKMNPGILSGEGFLGNDTRNLADILREDQSEVDRLGTTHKTIAERMEYFTAKGKNGLGKPVLVDNNFEVTVDDYMGAIPCPFSDHWNAEKRNTTVRNLKLNKTISWTDLNIHMINEHGFYEGKGSDFRVNPSKLCEVLGMV